MSETIANDMLEGAAEIAEYLGKSERQANYLLEQKQIPAFKIGGRWHMRKSTYLKFLERLEGRAA